MMSKCGSVSCGVYVHMGLTRDIIKEAMAELAHRRTWQVELGGIIRATRFKYFEGRDLIPTTCGKCGQEDNFRHLLACFGLTTPVPSTNSESTIEVLAELARRAGAIHAGTPIPRRPTEAGEIELSQYPTPSERAEYEEYDLDLTGSE